jgi:inosine-uridine nucleoside N-ribohydrolase
MNGNRRQFVSGMAAVLSAMGAAPAMARGAKPFAPLLGARSRVIFVNDLSGDPDGLFAAVHAMLSPSIDLRAIVGTKAAGANESAADAAALAAEMLRLTSRAGQVKVYQGSEKRLATSGTPDRTAGAQAIIDEAMRSDTTLPLYVAVGGGLTEVASALMIEPAIAAKFTLLWIGGDPYPAGGNEYNFAIDPIAASHVFNESPVPIWQITSAVYKTCAVSNTEIQAYVAPHGAIGAWLYAKLIEQAAKINQYKVNIGETYTLGDSPLVLLTALTDWIPSGFRPGPRYERTGSSPYDEIFAPRLLADGKYEARSEGRKIRVYRSVDTRLMFGDFFAKLQMNARG